MGRPPGGFERRLPLASHHPGLQPAAMNKGFEAAGIVDQLAAIYEESVANLRAAIAAYIRDRSRPDPASRAQGCFGYPELRIDYRGQPPLSAPARAFARLTQPGIYATSIARPDLFRDY